MYRATITYTHPRLPAGELVLLEAGESECTARATANERAQELRASGYTVTITVERG